MKLGKRIINANSRPYIIAEIGVNHEGSIDNAKKLIDYAKEGGADAAKFQTYKANTLASKFSPAYWDTTKETIESQYELFQKYDHFTKDDYVLLAEYCRKKDIDFLSTPFDDNAIEFLDPLVPFFKIASSDITNIPFLRKIGSKNKPVVLSTGASTIEEIDLAIYTLINSGCESIALLHCILNYPTSYENANLRMIRGLIKNYPNYIVGYSDHTLPNESMTSLITAYLLGAVIIEKHFTFDKTLPGNDHYHAMDLDDLLRLIDLFNLIQVSLGDKMNKSPIDTENTSRLHARRSIVLNRNVSSGHILRDNDLTYKRPGSGISPLHWDKVIGMRTINNLETDHILKWSDISEKEVK